MSIPAANKMFRSFRSVVNTLHNRTPPLLLERCSNLKLRRPLHHITRRNQDQLLCMTSSQYIKPDHPAYLCANYSASASNKTTDTEDSRPSQTGDSQQSGVEQEKSANQTQEADNQTSQETEEVDEKQLTVVQRFKLAYKQHGKVLIGVHLITSTVWFGSFFYAAKVGVDVVPLMEYVGFSEKITSKLQNSSAGDVALAYLMYKLATPARYTVTLTGTNFAIKYLRNTGKMEPKSENLKDLFKDGRDELTEKTKDAKEKFDKRREDKKKDKEDR